jgi:hypothetical protein
MSLVPTASLLGLLRIGSIVSSTKTLARDLVRGSLSLVPALSVVETIALVVVQVECLSAM